MSETPKRRPGRPATGVTPKRNIRVGDEWDQAEAIAAADGETMTKLVSRLLREYLAGHAPNRPA